MDLSFTILYLLMSKTKEESHEIGGVKTTISLKVAYEQTNIELWLASF